MMAKKMMRHNDGKVQLTYVFDFPTAMSQLSRVMEGGAKKYEQHNWKEPGEVRQIMNSLLRHAMAYQNGEDLDPESGLHHMAHAMFNCAAIIEQTAMYDGVDDRDLEHAYDYES